MDILKDFFEIFVRLEELIFFDGSETLEQIEEEMIFKVAGNNLVNDFERNICLDGINQELVVPVKLLDGFDVVGLQNYPYNEI